MWQAYPGDTPILDGGYVVSEAIYASDISGLSVQGLTVRNFLRIGIHIQNSSDVVIERNTVINIHSDGWNQAGVFLQNNIGNTKVTRNLIRDVNYCGILYANSKGETVKNLSIERNAIYSTCGAVADCGAIHADDRSHTASGIVIDNNIVGNYGSVATKARGVFLDDLLSNAVVSNNIIYGKGQYAFLIHGGDHNTIVNNIFDISGAENLAQYVGTPSLGPSYGMAGNTVTCNIVYSSALPPKVLWLQTLQSGDQLPTVTDNLYWGDVGVLPNSGQIVDTKPTVTNPRFVAPSQANYQFSSGVPAFCSSFKAIDTSQVGP